METAGQVHIRQNKSLQTAISELCLLNDDLMTLVFDKNIEATQLLLNIILQRNDLKVIEAVAQREYKNSMAGGRSITLDIYAVDGNGKVFDIEIQRAASGADVHRARFHSSMIDTKMLRKKQKFKELRDSYVIFITESDVLGAGLSLYHVERMIVETNTSFNDGSHIIYVNGSYKNDEDPIGKLMHDFRCVNPDEMFYQELAKHVKYFKRTEGGKNIMSNAFRELAEELAKELAEEKAKELAEEKAKELAEEKAKELAEEKAKELAKEMAEELAEEKAKELAEEKAEKLAEEKAKKLVEEKAEKLAEEKAKKLAEEKVEKLAEEKAKKLAEIRTKEHVIEEKKVLACRMLTRGKMTVEEIAEDIDLSVEIVRDLAGVQLA